MVMSNYLGFKINVIMETKDEGIGVDGGNKKTL